MFLGVLLLLIGLLMLLEKLGVIYGEVWDYLLPVALIAFGASMVFRNKRSDCQ